MESDSIQETLPNDINMVQDHVTHEVIVDV